MVNTTKRVSYTASNSYETLNKLTEKTKNIWIVLHGMGYLSRYFLKPFQALNSEENYIISPQAPSKYYLKNDFKYVGASWLTKEDTPAEIENVMAYLQAVLENEPISSPKKLVLFGFSQGVSIVTRFMVRQQLRPSNLILYAGGIPRELKAKDFEYLDLEQTEINMVYGSKDHFLTPDRLQTEFKKLSDLFKGRAKIVEFDGGHEILPDVVKKLVEI